VVVEVRKQLDEGLPVSVVVGLLAGVGALSVWATDAVRAAWMRVQVVRAQYRDREDVQ
jgi:hypothetical protein